MVNKRQNPTKGLIRERETINIMMNRTSTKPKILQKKIVVRPRLRVWEQEAGTARKCLSLPRSLQSFACLHETCT